MRIFFGFYMENVAENVRNMVHFVDSKNIEIEQSYKRLKYMSLFGFLGH